MSKRRSFLKSVTTLGAASLLPQISMAKASKFEQPPKIKPNKIKKGATIGLVAPGFAIKKEALFLALEALEKMGYKTHHTQRIIGHYGYFSNTDEERAKDINEMFANPDIDVILCARGGYGSTRILDMLDYEVIKNNPKPFIGFSDITAIINTIYQKTGLVAFHGPMGSTIDDEYSQMYLNKILMDMENPLPLKNAILNDPRLYRNSEYYRYTISHGSCQGQMVGGSLTLVTAMIGTPYEINFEDKIVFLEEVQEAPYRIDRMLTQLIQNESFLKAKGIVFGVFLGCDRQKVSENFILKEVIMDRIAPLGIPAAYGLSFGHVTNNLTLPIGVEAYFDATKKRLRLIEPAVS